MREGKDLHNTVNRTWIGNLPDWNKQTAIQTVVGNFFIASKGSRYLALDIRWVHFAFLEEKNNSN